MTTYELPPDVMVAWDRDFGAIYPYVYFVDATHWYPGSSNYTYVCWLEVDVRSMRAYEETYFMYVPSRERWMRGDEYKRLYGPGVRKGP